jgi:predicted HTH transcriptional regulator
MPEQQTIEYKSVWKDEYLKWICGFANAQGGTLVIGKDDSGNVVGIKNADKLLEDLPNKITTILGIVADVNLHETEQGDYVEIVVEPQPLYYYASSGFWVVFRKDVVNEEDLRSKGLSERQINAILYVKEKGKITNSGYQKINDCSRATANRDLTELVQKDILLFNDIAGAGANYQLKIIAS